MDYTNDKGERLYFPTEHAAEMALIDQGFDQDDKGFYRAEFPKSWESWTTASILRNGRGYFIRISVNLKN